jgi:hypothetical protein
MDSTSMAAISSLKKVLGDTSLSLARCYIRRYGATDARLTDEVDRAFSRSFPLRRRRESNNRATNITLRLVDGRLMRAA